MKQTMTRQASDNPYLHPDFHGALSTGIEYLRTRYGPEAVREYLQQFARAFYAPLREELARRGLPALQEHFERTYAVEGGEIEVSMTEDELVIKVAACPAVTHMRKRGYVVSSLFYETTRTVNETLCEGTPFIAELVAYDEETGASVQRFRRQP